MTSDPSFISCIIDQTGHNQLTLSEVVHALVNRDCPTVICAHRSALHPPTLHNYSEVVPILQRLANAKWVGGVDLLYISIAALCQAIPVDPKLVPNRIKKWVTVVHAQLNQTVRWSKIWHP